MESSLEQRERKDQEKADYVRTRQERLGHVSVETKAAPASKAKAKAKAKAPKDSQES